MRTSKLLYILLAFLMLSNGFFMFHFLTKPKPKGVKPELFLVKQLDFDAEQMMAYKALSEPHFKKMKTYTKGIRGLKNKLFTKVADENTTQAYVDSIAQQIGAIEKQKDIEVFNHFKTVKQLCNNHQKAKFTEIVLEALHRGPRGKKHLQ